MQTVSPKILLVDDEPNVLQAIRRQLYKYFDIDTATSGQEGLKKIRDHDCYAVIVADMQMPGMDGIQFLLAAKEMFPKSVRIMLTGNADQRTAIEAINKGSIFRFLTKPCSSEDLKQAIDAGVEQHRYILAEQSLQISEERYSLAVEGSSDGVWDWDILSDTAYYSPRFEHLLGFESGQMGQDFETWKQRIHPEDRDAVLDSLHNHLNCQTPYDIECRLSTKEQGHRWFRCRGQAIWDKNENATRMAGSIQDIHDRVVAQNSLKESNSQLQEMTDTAHRFVDNVAHEFRTPLMVIGEFSSLLVDQVAGPISEEQLEYLSCISDATQDLATLVDDFLDSSKLKSGTLRVDRRPHHVKDIFDSVRAIITSKAAASNITITERIVPGTPGVFVDLEKTGRVITNLVVNAIKFSPKGSEITLSAESRPDGMVRIGVADQGPGLSEEDLQTIFDRFAQVGDTQKASAKGFGLGLNISKELVWLNLGSMGVESELGKGSMFSFTLSPMDKQRIVEAYTERLLEMKAVPEQLGVFRVSASGCEEGVGGVRDFMISVSRPTDLVLGTDADESVILIAPTSEPDQLMEAIQQAHAKRAKKGKMVRRQREGLPSDLAIECLDLCQFATEPHDSRVLALCNLV